MSRKYALIIGNNDYHDPKLARLRTPGLDAHDFAGALRAPEIGAFDDVTLLVNEDEVVLRRAVARLFAQRQPDDLAVLYFSGHGVRDLHGDLYLAVKDTEVGLLSATALPAAFVTEQMNNSRSRRQVLILDCCHSGAFARGGKSAVGGSVGTAAAFEGTGYGRVVLTASDSTQYAWEEDSIYGEADNSVFTRQLVQGLETGEADANGDGRVTLDELYDYVYARVVSQTPRQTPGKWSYRQQGDLIIAQNPRYPQGRPVELPAAVSTALENPLPGVRESAVKELARLLRSGDAAVARLAEQTLRTLAEKDDSRRVAGAAEKALRDLKGAATMPDTARPEIEAELARQTRLRAEADSARIQKEQAERRTRAEEHSTPAARPGAVPLGDWLFANWLPWLIFALGWGLAWFIGQQFERSLINVMEGIPAIMLGRVFTGLLGGLVTAFALRLTLPAFGWPAALIVAGGWGLAAALGAAPAEIVYLNQFQWDWSSAWTASAIVAATLGSAIMAWTLWNDDLRARWRPAARLIGGFVLIWLLADVLGRPDSGFGVAEGIRAATADLFGEDQAYVLSLGAVWLVGSAVAGTWLLSVIHTAGGAEGLRPSLARVGEFGRVAGRPLAMIVVGWGLARMVENGLATGLASLDSGFSSWAFVIFLGWALCGLMGGLSLGFALQQSAAPVRISLAWVAGSWTAAWGVGAAIFLFFANLIFYQGLAIPLEAVFVVALAVVGLAGGLGMARGLNTPPGPEAVAWALAWPLAAIAMLPFGSFLSAALQGVAAASLGGGVLLWRLFNRSASPDTQ